MPDRNILERFARVNARRPCPVCDRIDWCLVEPDATGKPVAALCCRVQSPRLWGGAGWFHTLVHDYRRAPRPRCTLPQPAAATPAQLERRVRRAQEAFSRDACAHRLAQDLGVSRSSLERLGAGVEGATLLFPMVDGKGTLLGARLRSAAGHRSLKGSRNGLFAPRDLAQSERLYVAEGPTDTAALLTLRVAAIGRPCALGGADFVLDLVARSQPPEVVVVADADAPGRSGAVALATRLVLELRAVVRVVEPPAGCKDVRDWVRGGATSEDLQELVAGVTNFKLAEARRYHR